MNQYCPTTGEIHCKCLHKPQQITFQQVDFKAALRKLFTDHAVYTKFVINSVVDNSNDVNVLAPRLLQNQVDIGDQLKPIIGVENGDLLTGLLQEHIKRAKTTAEAATHQSPRLKSDINSFFKINNEIAAFFGFLNLDKLPYELVKQMFDHHSQQVVDMVTLRLKNKHHEEMLLFDDYYNHMLDISDAIYNAL